MCARAQTDLPHPTQLCLLTKSNSNGTPVATTTPTTQISVFYTPHQAKKITKKQTKKKLFGEMADFITGTGKTQDKPGI